MMGPGGTRDIGMAFGEVPERDHEREAWYMTRQRHWGRRAQGHCPYFMRRYHDPVTPFPSIPRDSFRDFVILLQYPRAWHGKKVHGYGVQRNSGRMVKTLFPPIRRPRKWKHFNNSTQKVVGHIEWGISSSSFSVSLFGLGHQDLSYCLLQPQHDLQQPPERFFANLISHSLNAIAGDLLALTAIYSV